MILGTNANGLLELRPLPFSRSRSGLWSSPNQRGSCTILRSLSRSLQPKMAQTSSQSFSIFPLAPPPSPSPSPSLPKSSPYCRIQSSRVFAPTQNETETEKITTKHKHERARQPLALSSLCPSLSLSLSLSVSLCLSQSS